MFRYLYRRAQLKGLFGGSKSWTIVWALFIGGRLFKRFTVGKPELVYNATLRPGQALVIRHGDGDRPGRAR